MKYKKIIAVLALIIGSSLIVSAGLLSFYAKVDVTANVQQSVVVSADGTNWNDYDEPFTTEITDMIHCTDYCNKRWIWNRACADANVTFPVTWIQAPDGDPAGFDVHQFLFGENQTIRLVQKEVIWGESPWTEVTVGMEAELTFSTCGKYFVWDVKSIGEVPLPTDYVLIYYANYPEYWDAAPAVVLGYLSDTIKSVDVPTMPYADDMNALRSIYIAEGEDYEHVFGAKFWLVPNTAVTNGVIDWTMADQFLFETDLGFYMDCDDLTPEPLPEVWHSFNLIGDHIVHVATLKSKHVYCWITCNHVALEIVPGIYKYQQLLQPTS